MPKPKRQSQLAPQLWAFKDLKTRRQPDGSLSFNSQGIEHICQLNNIPDGIFLAPVPNGPQQAIDGMALAWIREWNALTPHPHWHLIPGNYQENQEVLVFHWYLVYRLYGCTPALDNNTAFMIWIRGLAHEAIDLHMHLLSNTPQSSRRQIREFPGSSPSF